MFNLYCMKKIKNFFLWLYHLDWDYNTGTAPYIASMILALILAFFAPYIIGVIGGLAAAPIVFAFLFL